MSEQEPENLFEISKKEFPGGSYHIGKNQEEVGFYIHLGHIDSFSTGWLTNLSMEDFLAHASQLSNKVSQLNPIYRPAETANPIVVEEIATNKRGVASGTISAQGSYSGFEYNNIMVSTAQEYYQLTFMETGWPLNKEIIERAITSKNNTNGKYELQENTFVRVNTEFCTIIFNGEPGLFTYWSHVPAINAVVTTFSQTSTQPELADNFKDALNILTSPDFAQFIPEQKVS